MQILLDLVLEVITWLIPWPSRERSLMGESRLERNTRYAAVVGLIIVMLVGIGLGLWMHFKG